MYVHMFILLMKLTNGCYTKLFQLLYKNKFYHIVHAITIHNMLLLHTCDHILQPWPFNGGRWGKGDMELLPSDMIVTGSVELLCVELHIYHMCVM